jgi:hypothetical protein
MPTSKSEVCQPPSKGYRLARSETEQFGGKYFSDKKHGGRAAAYRKAIESVFNV